MLLFAGANGFARQNLINLNVKSGSSQMVCIQEPIGSLETITDTVNAAITKLEDSGFTISNLQVSMAFKPTVDSYVCFLATKK